MIQLLFDLIFLFSNPFQNSIILNKIRNDFADKMRLMFPHPGHFQKKDEDEKLDLALKVILQISNNFTHFTERTSLMLWSYDIVDKYSMS